jgi:hypothetical protein
MEKIKCLEYQSTKHRSEMMGALCIFSDALNSPDKACRQYHRRMSALSGPSRLIVQGPVFRKQRFSAKKGGAVDL